MSESATPGKAVSPKWKQGIEEYDEISSSGNSVKVLPLSDKNVFNGTPENYHHWKHLKTGLSTINKLYSPIKRPMEDSLDLEAMLALKLNLAYSDASLAAQRIGVLAYEL